MSSVFTFILDKKKVVEPILVSFAELEENARDSFHDRKAFTDVFRKTLKGENSLENHLLKYLREIENDIHWYVLQYFSPHFEDRIDALSDYFDQPELSRRLENWFYTMLEKEKERAEETPASTISIFKIAYEPPPNVSREMWLPSSFSIDFVDSSGPSAKEHHHLRPHFNIPRCNDDIIQDCLKECKDIAESSEVESIVSKYARDYLTRSTPENLKHAAYAIVNAFDKDPEKLGTLESYAKLFLFVQLLSPKVRHIYYFAMPIQHDYPGPALLVAACDELKPDSASAVYSLISLLSNTSQFTESNLAKVLIQNHARKAAVAAVMSRNMSHNIGSHVLADLSTKQRIQEIITQYSQVHNRTELFDEEEKDFDSPDIAMSVFNQYLKSRMDFLADLATSLPVVENQKYLLQDIVTTFGNNRLLKERIPALAGFDYEISLYEQFDSQNRKLLTESTDVCVSMPNDVLGIHAFYVILENFIRNCAKHEHVNGKIDIGFLKGDHDNELIKVEIFSNCKKDADAIDAVVKERNKDVKESVLKEGSLRPGAWGILEMKVAANYLRKYPVDEIDNDKNPLLLEAINFNDEAILGYRFYLKKPKELLVLCPNGSPSHFPQRQGIDYIEHNALRDAKQAFNHRLMLLINPADELKETVREKRNLLPMRSVEINDTNQVNELLRQFGKKTADITTTLWQEYSKRIIQDVQIICKKKDTQRNGQVVESDLFKVPENGNRKQFRAAFHLHCKSFDPSDYDYYEIYGSSANIAQMLGRLSNDKSLMYQLVEAFLTKVAIVDERIQEFVFNDRNNHLGKPLLEHFQRINLELPLRSEIDLNAKNFNKELKERIIKWMKSGISEKKVDFIVIHLGIIEKIYGTGATNVARATEVLNGSDARIIVISGRGRKPEDIPDDMLFLPYSTVSQFVIENRSKYHLTQLLYAARSNK